MASYSREAAKFLLLLTFDNRRKQFATIPETKGSPLCSEQMIFYTACKRPLTIVDNFYIMDNLTYGQFDTTDNFTNGQFDTADNLTTDNLTPRKIWHHENIYVYAHRHPPTVIYPPIVGRMFPIQVYIFNWLHLQCPCFRLVLQHNTIILLCHICS